MSPDPSTMEVVAARIERGLSSAGDGPLIVGVCGAQGSGKSTLAAGLARHFNARDVPTAILSIDDLYLTLGERMSLARRVHPLLRTRGVPGTHDIALGLAVLDGISAGAATPLPRFDKAADDRAPSAEWDAAAPGTRLVILEGWCVGACAQPASMLATPINDLEREEDAAGIWRRHANAALLGEYQALFARIDLLVLLAAPAFETVFGWRIEQERALRARTGHGMTDAEIIRFVRHYERVTRHILIEMPDRADLVIRLDERRRPVSIAP